jgi:hypothetical protein
METELEKLRTGTAQLLITTQGTGSQELHLGHFPPDFQLLAQGVLELPAGGSGTDQPRPEQDVGVVLHPIDEIGLTIVVSNEGNGLQVLSWWPGGWPEYSRGDEEFR